MRQGKRTDNFPLSTYCWRRPKSTTSALSFGEPYYHPPCGVFSLSQHSAVRRWLVSREAWSNWEASPTTWRSAHLSLGLRKHSGDVMLCVYSQFWLCVECSSVNKGPNPCTDFLECQGCCGLVKLKPGILVKANNTKRFKTGLLHSLESPFFYFRYLQDLETNTSEAAVSGEQKEWGRECWGSRVCSAELFVSCLYLCECQWDHSGKRPLPYSFPVF